LAVEKLIRGKSRAEPDDLLLEELEQASVVPAPALVRDPRA
jgi:hypothetical protein